MCVCVYVCVCARLCVYVIEIDRVLVPFQVVPSAIQLQVKYPTEVDVLFKGRI